MDECGGRLSRLLDVYEGEAGEGAGVTSPAGGGSRG